MNYLRRFITTLSLAVFLGVSLPNMAFANESGTETGDDVAIVFDLVVLRPVGLVATAAGLLIFVGSLPISIPTLSVGKALNSLVVGPARYTFVRELGEASIPPP
jgi:hypothetical protein